MQPLTITQTEATPYVCLDNQQGTIHIKGNSYDEDSFTFYEPVLKWLDQYKLQPQKETTLTIELKYFNTSSAKCLYELLDRLVDIRSNNTRITVNWFYGKNDLEMKQEIQGFSQLVEIPFNIQEIS